MLGRYYMVSGIPMSRASISDEIRNMIVYLVEQLFDFPEWETFEFITEKSGRRGPSKEECIDYYNQK